jgi:hypothetical protein
MLLRKNHRHTGMDLRYELIRLACDNRASAQPLPRFGIFPVFPEPGKGERASVLSWRSRTVASVLPFYAIHRIRPQESGTVVCESLSIGRRFIDGLSSGVDGSISDL